MRTDALDLISTLARMTTPTDGIGDSDAADEIMAELDDETLCGAASTLFDVIRKARSLVVLPYRIKVESLASGRTFYLTRNINGGILFYDRTETPNALSNLVGSNAAELRFRCEDAIDADAAIRAIETALASDGWDITKYRFTKL